MDSHDGGATLQQTIDAIELSLSSDSPLSSSLPPAHLPSALKLVQFINSSQGKESIPEITFLCNEALLKYRKHQATATAFANVLLSIIMNSDDENRNLVLTMIGQSSLPSLLLLLEGVPEDGTIKLVMEIIYLLCMEEANRTSLVGSSVVKMIITRCSEHVDSVEVQLIGFRLLQLLSQDETESFLAVQAGGFSAIMSTLAVHLDNSEVCSAAVGALSHLTPLIESVLVGSGYDKVDSIVREIVSANINVMFAFSGNEEIQFQCIGVLLTLSFNSKNRILIVAEGGLAVLLEAVKINNIETVNTELMMRVIYLLHSLFTDQVAIMDIISAIDDASVLVVIYDLVLAYSGLHLRESDPAMVMAIELLGVLHDITALEDNTDGTWAGNDVASIDLIENVTGNDVDNGAVDAGLRGGDLGAAPLVVPPAAPSIHAVGDHDGSRAVSTAGWTQEKVVPLAGQVEVIDLEGNIGQRNVTPRADSKENFISYRALSSALSLEEESGPSSTHLSPPISSNGYGKNTFKSNVTFKDEENSKVNMAALRTKCTDLEKENAALKESCLSLQNQLRDAENIIATNDLLKVHGLADLKGYIDKLRLKILKTNERINNAVAKEVSRGAAVVTQMESEVSRLRGEVKGLQSSNTLMNRSLRCSREMLSMAQEDCRSSVYDNKRMVKALKVSNGSLSYKLESIQTLCRRTILKANVNKSRDLSPASLASFAQSIQDIAGYETSSSLSQLSNSSPSHTSTEMVVSKANGRDVEEQGCKFEMLEKISTAIFTNLCDVGMSTISSTRLRMWLGHCCISPPVHRSLVDLEISKVLSKNSSAATGPHRGGTSIVQRRIKVNEFPLILLQVIKLRYPKLANASLSEAIEVLIRDHIIPFSTPSMVNEWDIGSLSRYGGSDHQAILPLTEVTADNGYGSGNKLENAIVSKELTVIEGIFEKERRPLQLIFDHYCRSPSTKSAAVGISKTAVFQFMNDFKLMPSIISKPRLSTLLVDITRMQNDNIKATVGIRDQFLSYGQLLLLLSRVATDDETTSSSNFSPSKQVISLLQLMDTSRAKQKICESGKEPIPKFFDR